MNYKNMAIHQSALVLVLICRAFYPVQIIPLMTDKIWYLILLTIQNVVLFVVVRKFRKIITKIHKMPPQIGRKFQNE